MSHANNPAPQYLRSKRHKTPTQRDDLCLFSSDNKHVTPSQRPPATTKRPCQANQTHIFLTCKNDTTPCNVADAASRPCPDSSSCNATAAQHPASLALTNATTESCQPRTIGSTCNRRRRAVAGRPPAPFRPSASSPAPPSPADAAPSSAKIPQSKEVSRPHSKRGGEGGGLASTSSLLSTMHPA